MLAILPLQAQQDLQALKMTLSQSKGIGKLRAYNALADYYLGQANDRVVDYAAEGIRHASFLKRGVETGTSKGNTQMKAIMEQETDGLILIGRAYERAGETRKAVKYYRQALRKAEKIGYSSGELRADSFLESLGKDKGIEINPGRVLQSMVETVEDIVKETGIEDDEAEEAREVSATLAEELGSSAEKKGNYQQAVAYYESMLPHYETANDTARLIEVYEKIQELHELLGDTEKAYLYQDKIATVRNTNLASQGAVAQIGSTRTERPLRELSELIGSQSAYEEQVFMEEEAETLEARDYYLQDAARLAEQGEYEASLNQLMRAQELERKIFAMKQQYREDSLETAYLVESKMQEIQSLKSQQELQQAQRQAMLIALIAFIAIAGLVGFLFFTKRRDHRKLTSAYTDLSDTHEQLKTTQTQLVAAEKMASLGQLTAGIAHEINNPVNFISGNTHPLRTDILDLFQVLDAYHQRVKEAGLGAEFSSVQELEEELDLGYLRSEISDLLSGIEEGAHRTTEIVSGLRTFARLDEGEYKRFDIHQGLDSTLSLLKSHLDSVEVIKDYGELPGIECYPGKLNQVFMNVLTNAIQAMPEGGLIHLKTELEKDTVRLSIQDTGKGMEQEVVARMFEPFFTTKDVGEGTGLGMSISHGIIRQHGGIIQAESVPGQGTKIVISLPVNQARVDQ